MNLQLKLIVLGSPFVGKTSLIKRITSNIFKEYYITTIGVDYDRIIVEHKNNNHEIILWDTSGQDKFNFILNSYFSSVNGAVIMCDISVYQSFNQAKSWIDEFRKKKNNDHIPILFIGNKIDIKDRSVSIEEIKEIEKRKNVKTIEISIKTNENVDKIFPIIIDDFFEKLEDKRISLIGDKIKIFKKTSSSFQIATQKEHENRCCKLM